MKRPIFLFVFFLVASFSGFSQGTIRGKITDESGETVIGAVVSLKSNAKSAVMTDLDGNYSVKVLDSLPQVLVISYVGYKTIEKKVPGLRKNAVFVSPFTLVSDNNLAEVEVVVKQTKAAAYYMENIKKKSATTIDYISAETMKRTGDASVVNAVARVSGVATSGGLITVRGIGDRYVKTTLNGSRIPTLDPLTNNIKLDIFPASLVDNIIITKTASPDLPGDWAGAYISVETKDYPEKLMVNVESQFGYNAQNTFKDYISSQRSSTDWLGFDNGLRNKSHDGFKVAVPLLKVTEYEEMVALGLKDYYKSLGINGWSVSENQTTKDIYFKLGLVQLGLLPATQFNDPSAYTAAANIYARDYKPKAFSIIYPDGTNFNNGLKTNWSSIYRKAPLNFTQSFSIGNQSTLFHKPLGYIFGLRYGSSIRFDPNGLSQRVGDESQDYVTIINDVARLSRQTNGWSALLNLSYKLNDQNNVSLLFMPNFTGTNDVSDYTTASDSTASQEGRTIQTQFYEQRKQLIYQIKSEHFIPSQKIKIDFNTSYTNGNSIAPDFKFTENRVLRNNITGEILNLQFSPTAEDGIRRYYRYLNETLLDSRLSAELPIGRVSDAGVRKVKFGASYLENTRDQNLYTYVVAQGNNNGLPSLNRENGFDEVLLQENFIVNNAKAIFVYERFGFGTIGKSAIKSAFAMTDYSLLSWLRVSGGLRVEHAQLFSDVLTYYQKGYGKDDTRRVNETGFPLVNAANFNTTDFLPSANLIFKAMDNSSGILNVRFNYSKTLARPSLRELNELAIFDDEFRTLIYGFSGLKTAYISNYDFRLESYFKNGDNVSASVFYKDFVDHIERVFSNGGITWNNVGESTVRGIEFEGKKRLGKHFECRANVTIVKSLSKVIIQVFDLVNGVKVYRDVASFTRPMFGQAPYIINSILSYNSDSLGLTATVSYNVQGPRLVITGIEANFPDVYEIARHLIDCKVSKTLGKHFILSMTVRDILNQPVRRAYKYNNNGKVEELPGNQKSFDSFRYGTNYLMSFAYKF